MAASCRNACHVTNLKLASPTWQRVLCTPGLNPKRIFGMWWHWGMTADKRGATVWHCHVNMGPNLWGTFPAIYWVYAKKNEGLQAKWGLTRSKQGGHDASGQYIFDPLVGKTTNSIRVNPRHSENPHLKSWVFFNSSWLLLCCLVQCCQVIECVFLICFLICFSSSTNQMSILWYTHLFNPHKWVYQYGSMSILWYTHWTMRHSASTPGSLHHTYHTSFSHLPNCDWNKSLFIVCEKKTSKKLWL